MTENESNSRRRHFSIQSEFGLARQWRSRKNRPCDACRKRKSACVIEDRPPCLFCRKKGLSCQATSDASRRRLRGDRSSSQDNETSDPHPTTIESMPDREGGLTMETLGSELDDNLHPRLEPTLSMPIVEDQQDYHSNISPRPATDNSFSLLSAPVLTLEDNENLTAHALGLSAEQDTHLLASFRSVLIDETNRINGDFVQVHPGTRAAGIPPIHFAVIADEFMPYDNRVRDEASNLVESKVGQYGPDLIRLYFTHVHPVYCVVSKVRFLRAYRLNKLSIPVSLRAIMYGLASVYWKQDPILSTVQRPFDQYELFHAAQASLDKELDAPNLWKMQACLLLLHEKVPVSWSYESPKMWTQTAQAVACAQMIGLHRDPSDWNIAPWEKSLRKRLWWATFMTDTWSAVSFGNPPHIYDASYTTSNLSMEDLKSDEDVPEDLRDMIGLESASFDVSNGARFMELIGVTQILHHLLDMSFTDHSYRSAMMNLPLHEANLLQIQTKLDSWHALIPQCVTTTYTSNKYKHLNNAPLQLAYHATQMLLLRAIMTPASMEAKLNPNSSLRRFFGAAMNQVDEFLDFINMITVEGLRAFWGRHARSQFILIGNFMVLLFLLSSSSDEVHSTFKHLEQFHESLERLGELTDEESVSLIRPVALRVDSFFTQAAQIMRSGSTTGGAFGSNIINTPS